jgi:pSer/pThr/pTyr-binding forkhead associated (FHA) protein
VITLSLLNPINQDAVQNWTFENEDVIRVGRSTENDVILYSAVVSRHHVEIRKAEEGWYIKNIGTNGTYINGKRIDQVQVEDGLVIRLARSGPNIRINIASKVVNSSIASIQDILARRQQLAKLSEGQTDILVESAIGNTQLPDEPA